MACMKSCEEWKPFMAMLAIDLSLAIVNILLKKVLEEGLNHLAFITYRLTIATIFLAPISYFLERNSRPKLSLRILICLFISAIVGTSLTQYFFLLGIQYTSATFACAFVNTVPVITFLMALPFRLEIVDIKHNSGRAKVLGTLVCIAGAILLTTYRGMPLFDFPQSNALSRITYRPTELNSDLRNKRWTLGSLYLTVGTLFWSSWFLVQSSISKRYPCQYSSTAIMSFFGAIQSAILSCSTSRNLSTWILRGKLQIITLLYSGIVASGLGFVGMSWCVKKRGPVFTAAFSPLVQIMTAMFDIPILHEQLHLGSLLGSIIVMIGLYILLWGKKEEMQNHVKKLAQESGDINEQESEMQAITISSSTSPQESNTTFAK